jgi:hypothetical protein
LQKLVGNFDQQLTTAQHRVMADLIRRHYRSFLLPEEKAGVSSLKPMSIDLYPGAQPQNERLRRQSDYEMGVISDHVDKLLECGYIEPSSSEWASNIVLVKKKSGAMRVCVDYKRLNAMTLKYRYPMPHMDTILRRLEGKPWLSTLDLSSAYHQIALEKGDRKKSAFITHRGLFQYKVIPFGLTCACGFFQAAMSSVLSGVSNASCWIDDILIASATFEEHVKDLAAVFSKIGSVGLSLSAEKSYLFRRELSYLGYIIGPTGVRPNPEKVAAVSKWPLPTCLSEVRAFCGLVNFYRRFIPGCSVVMSPLTDLSKGVRGGKAGSKNDVKFDLTRPDMLKARGAFEKLKELLITAPVLRHPMPNKMYRLEVDASKKGVGAVLSQKFDDGIHPVAFYSKKYSEAESRYTGNGLEAIGVIKALDHFRPYIYGMDFELVSDSQNVALAWVRKHSTGRLARWSIRLAEYDGYMKIVPRAGKKMGNCDGLSRRGFGEKEATSSTEFEEAKGVPPLRRTVKAMASTTSSSPTDEEAKRISTAEIDAMIAGKHDAVWDGVSPGQPLPAEWDYGLIYDEVLLAQRADSYWSAEILRQRGLTGDKQPDPLYRYAGGLLFRLMADGLPRLVIPMKLKYRIVSLMHDGFMVSHLGIHKTTALLKSKFWWKGLDTDVREYTVLCFVPKTQGDQARTPTPFTNQVGGCSWCASQYRYCWSIYQG